MKQRSKIIVIALGLGLSLISCLAYIGSLPSSTFDLEEIERRGWRVLYSNQEGGRLVAICDAGQNKIAVVDTEKSAVGGSFNIGDSEHHGITAGSFEDLSCPGLFGSTRIVGWIFPIRVPPDGRIRVIHQAAFRSLTRDGPKSGGEILLDVEVDWNAEK